MISIFQILDSFDNGPISLSDFIEFIRISYTYFAFDPYGLRFIFILERVDFV